MGFSLSKEGIAPIMSHTEAILSLPDPQSPSQMSSFLGMATYYLRFLPHYSETTAPLCQLLRKEAFRKWTPSCHVAVRTIKEQPTSPPTLTYFGLTAPTLVTCDASGVAMGAVLSQVHDGVERQVAFGHSLWGSRNNLWGRGRPWPVCGHVNAGMSSCTGEPLLSARIIRR